MPMSLDTYLKRDRTLVLLSVVTMIVLAWAYILMGAGTGMSALHMSGFPTAAGVMAAMEPVTWSTGYAALMIAMWWLMMVGMMLPAAAPMILLFAAVARKQTLKGTPGLTAGFVAGYLTVWGGFSLVAVVMQWTLEGVALLSPEMVMTSVAIGAMLLIGAGAWQLTPLKEACLRKCRAPLYFLTEHWQSGTGGAWRMGITHGAYCLGCCWVLMLLLFYGGVMNVYWIAGLAVFVLIEKTAKSGHWVGKLGGFALIAWGTALLVGLAWRM